jgi:hypothetical protein
MERILTAEEIAALFSAMSLYDPPVSPLDCSAHGSGIANFDPCLETADSPLHDGDARDAR